jgi:hypothetical protein
MLFVHTCSREDAKVLRDAANVLVNLFGKDRGARTDGQLAELEARVGAEGSPALPVAIAGVEFTNSGLSCTLLIARPQAR